MQYLLFSLELSLTFEVVREGKNLTRVNPILPWGGAHCARADFNELYLLNG